MAPLHHVGITVGDLDRAVEFYRDVLGLAAMDRFAVDGEAVADAVDVPEPARRSSTSPGTASGRTRRVLPRRRADRTARLNRAGTTHLSLAVDDLDAVSEQLPADVETLSEPRTTSSGTRILVHDPEHSDRAPRGLTDPWARGADRPAGGIRWRAAGPNSAGGKD